MEECDGLRHRRGVEAAGDFLQRTLDDGFTGVGNRLVVRVTVLVDLADGGARNDVVELVQKDKLPGSLQFRCRVLRRIAGGKAGKQFGITQEKFADAVALFVRGLRGVGAAVQFEVELADPGCEVVRMGFGLPEEIDRALVLSQRGVVGSQLAATQKFKVPFGRATTAISVTEQVERLVGAGVVTVIFDRVDDFLGFGRPVVGVCRREVCPHARTVVSLPPERVVGELVGLVPADLLGQEVRDVELREDLGECCGIAEHVG